MGNLFHWLTFSLRNTKIGISEFRSICLGFPSLTSQWTKLRSGHSCKKRQDIWPSCLTEPQGTPEDDPSAAWNPVGVEMWVRLPKAGDGWDELRVAPLRRSLQLEYETTVNCVQSCSWPPYHRLLSPALKDYLILSLSHLFFMYSLLTKTDFRRSGLSLLNPEGYAAPKFRGGWVLVYVTHHYDLASKSSACHIR